MAPPENRENSPEPTSSSPVGAASHAPSQTVRQHGAVHDRQGEAKFFLASIVESSQDSIVTIGFNGIITSWNRAAELLYGYDAREAIGQPLLTLTLPENLREVLRNIENVKHSQKVEVFDSVRAHKDGREIHLEVVMSPVKDAAGLVIGVSTIARDMTERRLAEAAMREGEERLAAIFTQAKVGLSEIAPKGSFLRVNDELCRMTGRSRQELLTLNVADVTYPDDLSRSLLALGRLLENQEAVSLEKRCLAADGTVIWTSNSLTPLRDARRQLQSVLAVTVDLTQHRQAEEARHQSEERLRFLVEGTRDYAMFLMDAQRRIFHWNSGAQRLFGYSREEIMGQSGDLIFTLEDREAGAPEEEAQQAVEQGSAPDVRWHQRKDGSLFWSDGINTGLRGEGGELLGFARILRDATREREAEEALHRAHEELEWRVQERTQELSAQIVRRQQLEQERSQLTQRIVNVQEEERKRISRELHDNMGQHLTAITMALQALQKAELQPEVGERRGNAATIARLSAMVEDLTGITHRLAWELRPAALDNVGLEAALSEYVAQWSQKNGIAADFASNSHDSNSSTLSRSFERALSSEESTALYRIVQEALTNVVRHAGASRVSVVLEQNVRFISAIIEDNGRGFDVEAMSNSKRLGVRGMQERMELVGGSLEVESVPGEGTTVYARVPL